MTATDDDTGSEYEHWPNDDHYLQTTAVAAPGYDSHNGLRSYIYEKAPSPAAPKAQPCLQPQVVYSYPQQQMMTYPPMQYTYQQAAPMAYPPQAYYGYQQPGFPQQQMQGYPVYQPAYCAPQPAPAPAPKSAAPKPNKWVARTKAQVEEDNMKIAAEGACDKRKVVPIGMKEDQMMWCVEVDGSHTLR